MTVKQLKDMLNDYPDNAEVALYNNDSFENGLYEATGVRYADDNIVEILTDYDYLWDFEDSAWKA